MKKFSKFVQEEIILEKVSQKEYSDAEKDKNIRIGIEFEVVNSALVASANSGYNMNDVEQDYENYVESIVDYADEIVNSRNDWNDEIEEHKNDKLTNIQDEIDSKVESVDTITNTIEELENEISDLNDAMDGENDDELQDQIRDIESRIEELESEKDDLQMDIGGLESDHEDVSEQYGDEYADEHGLGQWDGPDPGYFNAGLYDEWSNDMGESLPDQSDIVSWCFEKTEYGTDSIGRHEVSSDLLEYLPYPSEDYYESDGEFDVDGDAYLDLVKKVTKGKEPDVGGYHASANYKKWRVEEDSSLNSGGAEIISPVLTLSDGIEAIENMFDWIDDYADTDSSCGLHVNMSFDGYDMTKFDWLKLLFFVEEGAIYKKFSDRKENSYARPIHNYLSSVQRNPESIGSKEYFKALSKAESQGFSAVKDKIGSGKFFGVNFSSIMSGSSNGRIEFRYMGGNYHKKGKAVKQQILQYAAWMKIALDPKYKRQEYLKKLAKFASGANEKATAVNMKTNFEGLGETLGMSGDKKWILAYDTSKKIVYVFGSDNKIILQLKLVQALNNPRIKRHLISYGYVIKDLIKGKVTLDTRLGQKYRDAWKLKNPDGKISTKDADKFVLDYKQ